MGVSDPLIDYVFNQPGTYMLRVSANVVWNSTTSDGIFSVPNTFRVSGSGQQPVTGMGYQLFLSLQGHPANPAQINFAGDTVVITSGRGAGETATIQSYDPEQQVFILSGSGFTLPNGGTAPRSLAP